MKRFDKIFLLLLVTSTHYVCHAQKEMDINYERCAQFDAICFGLPFNCFSAKNCEILLTVQRLSKTTNSLRFQIMGPIGEQPVSNRFLAMSLGFTPFMGGSVTACALANNGNVFLINGFNTGHRSEPMGDVDGVALTDGHFRDGVLSCTWTRNAITSVNNVTIDVQSDSYHLHVSKGVLIDNYLTHHTNKVSSPVAINLQSEPKNVSFVSTIDIF